MKNFFNTWILPLIIVLVVGVVLGFAILGIRFLVADTSCGDYTFSATAETEIEVKKELNEVEVFSKLLDEKSYKSLTHTELENLLNEAFEIVSIYLGLETKDQVYVVYRDDVTWWGMHYGGKDKIEINLYTIGKSPKKHGRICVSTIFHEARHDAQEEMLQNGITSPLTESYKNYITPDVDYQGYYNQLAEQDARLFSEQFLEYIDMVIENHQETIKK